MDRQLLIGFLLLCLASSAARASDTSRPDNNDVDQSETAVDSEAGGIIPQGGITVSTQPLTPIVPLQQEDPYTKALNDLAIAQNLIQQGRMEAASDVSLLAYDDLMSVYVPRRIKKKRKKLQADRRVAATAYINSSLSYIEDYVKRAGSGPHAREEGHARLGDLRDVSMNYPELNKKVTEALERYAVVPSTTPFVAPRVLVSTPTVSVSTYTVSISTTTVTVSTPAATN